MTKKPFALARWIAPLLPLGLLVPILVLSEPAPEDDSAMTAGFGKKVGSRRGPYKGFSSSRSGNDERRRLTIRLPSLKRAEKPVVASTKSSSREITVAKSSTKYQMSFNSSRSKWKYLSRSVRSQIDDADIDRGRWRYIVVHNSATAKGNAKVFDYYHRNVKRMSNGLAYHFVIGNGSYSGNGEIEVGNRWSEQLQGGHLKSSSQNDQAIGICLVGDFNQSRVRKEQLEALDELIDYIEAKVGTVRLTTHKRINVSPTSCPGRFFPENLLTSGRK